MNGFFADLVQILTPVFAISSMSAVGLGHSPADIVAPLRSWRLVAAALVASFVLVPLLAWAVTRLFSLDEPFETGLFLVASAAGAPFVIKFVEAAGGNLALTAGVLVVQLVVTVVFMPLYLPTTLESDVDVNTVAIAFSLTWTMLAPLAVALVVRIWRRGFADWLRPSLGRISTTTLSLLVASTVIANYDGILDIFGEGAILASTVVLGGASAGGYLLGGRDRDARMVLSFSTGQRNIAAAMVVATQNFGDERDVMVMVVVTSLVGLAILFPLAFAMRRRLGTGEAGAQQPARAT